MAGGKTGGREDFRRMYAERLGTVEDCLALIRSGDTIWCSNNYNEPRLFFSGSWILDIMNLEVMILKIIERPVKQGIRRDKLRFSRLLLSGRHRSAVRGGI